MRTRYWSNSRFADWLRGTKKPTVGTSKEWHDWEKESNAAHPIRYWIAEEALDAIQNFIWWPIDKIYNVKYYINNRWVTRTHCLTAHPRDIKPGRWQDVGNRFLPCLFNELVDYVEVELAWWHVAWDDEARKKFGAPWWGYGWFRWRTWRSPEAGLANLEWQMSLKNNEDWMDKDDPDFGKPTYQAQRAKEVYELYKWWTEIYHSRPDPHIASGWSEYCERRREETGSNMWIGFDESESSREESSAILDKVHEMEKAYDQEDEEMMIRLIKVRGSLWT